MCIRDSILAAYREFLKENKGFVETKTTADIVIPKSFKTPDKKGLDEILNKIEEVIDNGKLKDLYALAEKVL